MTISAIAAPNFTISKKKLFNKKAGYTAQDDPSAIIGTFAGCETTKLTEERNDSRNWTAQLLATYTKKFGDHDVNIMGGYENYYYFHESLDASRDQYDLDGFPYLNAGPSNIIGNSGSAYETHMIASARQRE